MSDYAAIRWPNIPAEAVVARLLLRTPKCWLGGLRMTRFFVDRTCGGWQRGKPYLTGQFALRWPWARR